MAVARAEQSTISAHKEREVSAQLNVQLVSLLWAEKRPTLFHHGVFRLHSSVHACSRTVAFRLRIHDTATGATGSGQHGVACALKHNPRA